MATIDSRDFGAYPGTTTYGIQEAIDALPANGGTVHIPSGDYYPTSTIQTSLTKETNLVGDGIYTTRIHFTSAQKDLNMIEARTSNIHISGMSLLASGTAGGKGRGIQIGTITADDAGSVTAGVHLEDLHINGFSQYGVGFYGNDATVEAAEGGPKTTVNADSLSVNCLLSNLYIICPGNVGNGIYVGSGCTTISIRDCNISGHGGGASTAGIKLYGAQGVLIDRTILETGIDARGVIIYGGASNKIRDCWFEQDNAFAPSYYYIDIKDTVAGSPNACTIMDGCHFVRPAGSGNAYFFQLAGTTIAASTVNIDAIMGTDPATNSGTLNGATLTAVGYYKVRKADLTYINMVIA